MISTCLCHDIIAVAISTKLKLYTYAISLMKILREKKDFKILKPVPGILAPPTGIPPMGKLVKTWAIRVSRLVRVMSIYVDFLQYGMRV
jgi:hypothetical protein